MQKAATTAQQPCFSTKFALCQKPLTQNEKKKKFVCFFYFSPFGHRFHPCPPSAGTACSHVPPPSTAKCAGSQQANTKVTEEGTGQKTIQAGRELRLQKKPDSRKKEQRLAISRGLPCSNSLPASPIPFPKSWLSSTSPIISVLPVIPLLRDSVQDPQWLTREKGSERNLFTTAFHLSPPQASTRFFILLF